VTECCARRRTIDDTATGFRPESPVFPQIMHPARNLLSMPPTLLDQPLELFERRCWVGLGWCGVVRLWCGCGAVVVVER